jgi:hypothetical protein
VEEEENMKRSIVVVILMMLVVFTSISCTVASKSTDMQAPEKPTITGPDNTECGVMCEYHIMSSDPQNDVICYEIKCSDSPACIFTTDYYDSGEDVLFCHCWDDFYQQHNPFVIQAKAIDGFGHESEWTYFNVEVQNKAKMYNPGFFRLIQQNQMLFRLLVNLLDLF